MTIFGIDISHHQGDLDLSRIAATGQIDFVMAKLSEGDGFTDPNFARYRAQAEASDLLFAGYHFLRGDSDPRAQVSHVKRLLGDSQIPVIIDIERTNGMPQPDMSHVNAFTRAGRDLGVVVSPLLYLPEWYWSEIGRPSTAGWSLWQSNYGSNNGEYPGDESSRWTTQGRQAGILQFTSNGRVSGYGGPLDINAFRGTREELAQKGWFIDYRENEVATKAEIQNWVATTPIVVDGAGTKEPLQKVLRQILNKPAGSGGATAEEIAAQVVASLPPDNDLTRADVQKALAAALRGGLDNV